jgi:hypothetical protein
MNKPFIAYDISSLPDFSRNNKVITLPEILEIKEATGYLFYDSRKGKKPEIMNGDIDIKIVDYAVPKWRQKLKLIVRKINKSFLIKKLKHD